MTALLRAPRVYLDHAATTPLRPEVLDVLLPALRTVGNPSSAHASGRARRALLEQARDDLAQALGADPVEVVFTSGATEADDLAVAGTALAAHDRDPRRRIVVCSAVEHAAVLESAASLAEHGLSTVLLGVDATGRLDLDELSALLATDADSIAVVSVLAANNEIGTVQPLAEVVERCARYGIPVHADAAQAVGVLPVDFAASGLAALSLTGHKVGGPVGSGALVVRRDVAVRPRTHGGGQERGIRSGTGDAPGAIALAAAVTTAVGERAVLASRVRRLRDDLVAGVLARVDSVVVVGAPSGPDRLPGNAYLAFPGADVEALLFALDSAGVDASAGSACHSGVPRSSHVLQALRAGGADVPDGVRFSLGHTSTAADVESLLAVIAGCVAVARDVAAVPA